MKVIIFCFRNYLRSVGGVTMTLGRNASMSCHGRLSEKSCSITLVEAGAELMTAYRARHIEGDMREAAWLADIRL